MVPIRKGTSGGLVLSKPNHLKNKGIVNFVSFEKLNKRVVLNR